MGWKGHKKTKLNLIGKKKKRDHILEDLVIVLESELEANSYSRDSKDFVNTLIIEE